MKNEILHRIAQVIYDKKGSNILGLDVRGVSNLTDYVIIAEGNVDRHVIGMMHAIVDDLETVGIRPVHIEGAKTGDWVVIDFFDVMVHLFMPGLRDKYHLEELWKEGEIVDLHINTAKVVNG